MKILADRFLLFMDRPVGKITPVPSSALCLMPTMPSVRLIGRQEYMEKNLVSRLVERRRDTWAKKAVNLRGYSPPPLLRRC